MKAYVVQEVHASLLKNPWDLYCQVQKHISSRGFVKLEGTGVEMSGFHREDASVILSWANTPSHVTAYVCSSELKFIDALVAEFPDFRTRHDYGTRIPGQ